MANYLDVPGSLSGASTPNQAGLVAGSTSIDLRAEVAPTSWAPGSSIDQSLISQIGADRFEFYLRSDGTFDYIWRDSSLAYDEAISTAATGFANGSKHWVRVLHTISAGTVDFYTSSDGSSWTSLGSQITGKPTLAITTAGGVPPLRVGMAGGNGESFTGKVTKTVVIIGGSTIINMDWTTAALGTGTWVSGSGETWTVIASASVMAEPVGSRDVVGWTTRSGGY